MHVHDRSPRAKTLCFLHCFERGREKEAASWQPNYGPSITIQSVSRRGGGGPLWVTNQFKERDNYASIHLFLIFNIFFSSPVSLVPLGASRQAVSRAEWLQSCLVFFFVNCLLTPVISGSLACWGEKKKKKRKEKPNQQFRYTVICQQAWVQALLWQGRPLWLFSSTQTGNFANKYSGMYKLPPTPRRDAFIVMNATWCLCRLCLFATPFPHLQTQQKELMATILRGVRFAVESGKVPTNARGSAWATHTAHFAGRQIKWHSQRMSAVKNERDT